MLPKSLVMVVISHMLGSPVVRQLFSLNNYLGTLSSVIALHATWSSHDSILSSSNGSLAALADSQGNEQKHLLLLKPNRQQLKVDLPAPVVNVVNSADNSLLVSVRTDTGQDLWAVDTRKATSRKIASGPGVVRWFSANQGSGEFFTIERAKEGMQWSIRSPKSPSSTLPIRPPADDPFQYSPIGVLGQRIFALERPSDGFSRIVSLGIRDGEQTVVAAASGKDISSICFEPTGKPAFAEIAGAQHKSIGLTRRHQLLIDTYQRLIGAHVRVVARRSTGDLVIAQVEGRQTYAFIDRHGEATWYRSLVDCLEPDSEYFDEVIETRSRDGLRLEYIVSTPTHATHDSAVVLIHGGPWTHDTTDFSREVSEYISRGCQVVRVSFRGSTGYGTPVTSTPGTSSGAEQSWMISRMFSLSSPGTDESTPES